MRNGVSVAQAGHGIEQKRKHSARSFAQRSCHPRAKRRISGGMRSGISERLPQCLLSPGYIFTAIPKRLRSNVALYKQACHKAFIALVSELSYLVLFLMNQTRNPVTFVTQFCIGPWINMTIPVLRSVIAVVYSAVIVCLLAVLRSRKIVQDDSSAKANRQRLQE